MQYLDGAHTGKIQMVQEATLVIQKVALITLNRPMLFYCDSGRKCSVPGDVAL